MLSRRTQARASSINFRSDRNAYVCYSRYLLPLREEIAACATAQPSVDEREVPLQKGVESGHNYIGAVEVTAEHTGESRAQEHGSAETNIFVAIVDDSRRSRYSQCLLRRSSPIHVSLAVERQRGRVDPVCSNIISSYPSDE